MSFTHDGQTYRFKRYPPTQDRSLRALSAADELLLAELQTLGLDKDDLVIQHDRFGVLTTVLRSCQPQFVAGFRSQQKALEQQLLAHRLPSNDRILTPLEIPAPTGIGLLRVPKSLELFELYLAVFSAMVRQCPPEGQPTLLAGFMTRHFTPALLDIAGRYAKDVRQSKARKKARVLHIGNFRPTAPEPENLRHDITYDGSTYHQLAGVFSSGRIDYGTRFLLEQLTTELLDELIIDQTDCKLLDIACGNGVIGNTLLQRLPAAQLIATDDAWLAAESARHNLPEGRSTVYWTDGLEDIAPQSIDLATINPPFHFGYETNIEVSLRLFAASTRVLKPSGSLLIVANRHLNYRTHLTKWFGAVREIGTSEKFEILVASHARSTSE